MYKHKELFILYNTYSLFFPPLILQRRKLRLRVWP